MFHNLDLNGVGGRNLSVEVYCDSNSTNSPTARAHLLGFRVSTAEVLMQDFSNVDISCLQKTRNPKTSVPDADLSLKVIMKAKQRRTRPQ